MKQLALGHKGLEFLRSFLEKGDDLAKAASAQMHEDDEILTWLPDDLELADVSLREGLGSEEPPDEDIWKPLSELMREFLARNASHVVVVESGFMQGPNALPNWATFQEPPDYVPYFCCGGGRGFIFDSGERKEVHDQVSVFGFLSGKVTHSQVSELLDSTFPFHQVHVLTSLPDGKPIEAGSTMDREFLLKLGSLAEYISVGAYDGIGVVLWKRTNPKHTGDFFMIPKSK